MTKKHLQLTEAFDKFNSVLNDRLRFFIGGAIEDALILGNRSEIITEQEALELSDVLNEIMVSVRQTDTVKTFLSKKQKNLETL